MNEKNLKSMSKAQKNIPCTAYSSAILFAMCKMRLICPGGCAVKKMDGNPK